MKEDLVQFIWQQGLFDTTGLQTHEGHELAILEKGRIQKGQGPDIENALLRINNQLWAGTVEVHKRASEWYEHGHQNDPAYENVLLHVVMENDLSVRTLSGRTVPTLELTHRVDYALFKGYEHLMSSSNWIPCEKSIGQIDENLHNTWLDELLLKRIERKSKTVGELLDFHENSVNQAFYRTLLAAFGLKENSIGMAMLASELPYALLAKYRHDRTKLEALLLGCAGFLQVDFITPYARNLQKEFAYLRKLHTLNTVPIASWKFGGMRPAAFPTLRLALFAALVHKLDGNISALLAIKQVEALYDVLQVQASKPWNERYTLDQLSRKHPKRVGKTLQELIIVNAIVPFQFALGRGLNDPKLVHSSIELLGQMPSANDNIVKGWRRLGVKSLSMAHSQALVELKKEFCDQRKCVTCTIGQQVLKGLRS